MRNKKPMFIGPLPEPDNRNWRTRLLDHSLKRACEQASRKNWGREGLWLSVATGLDVCGVQIGEKSYDDSYNYLKLHAGQKRNRLETTILKIVGHSKIRKNRNEEFHEVGGIERTPRNNNGEGQNNNLGTELPSPTAFSRVTTPTYSEGDRDLNSPSPMSHGTPQPEILGATDDNVLNPDDAGGTPLSALYGLFREKSSSSPLKQAQHMGDMTNFVEERRAPSTIFNLNTSVADSPASRQENKARVLQQPLGGGNKKSVI